MIIESQLIDSCMLCGSKSLKFLALTLRKGQPHFCRVRCSGCGLVISSPMATKDSLKKYYENYYSSGNHASQTDFLGEKKRVKAAELTIKEIINLHPITNRSNFLDIGSGSGSVMAAANSVGFNCFGCELSESGVAFSKSHYALENVFLGELIEARYPDNFFDVVHCWHVIEHVTDPVELLREVSRVLKPGGLFYWGTDNHSSFGYMMLRLFSYLTLRPPPIYDGIEHTFGIDKRTITKIIIKSGFNSPKVFLYPDPIDFVVLSLDLKNHGIGKFFRTCAQSVFKIKMKGYAFKP